MLRKLFAISLTIALLLTSFVVPGIAAEPPSDKSAYFQDGAAVNCTPDKSGSNTLTVISGDVLKIMVTGKADPNFGIRFNDNIDTATYKILALKVKKTNNAALGGEVFWNTKDGNAEGGKSVTFNYAEGTDYQWVYIDLGAKSAGQVGFLRYDVYQESPTDLEFLTLACAGFFKSQDDATAFAQSDTGKNLGTNEGNKGFPIAMAGALAGPGVWLNTVPDAEKPGSYWVKFNTGAPFTAINILQIYAKAAVENTGKLELYKYNGDFDTTMSGTPVATQAIKQTGDAAVKFNFGKTMEAGQYVLYIEQDTNPDIYFNIGTVAGDPDGSKFEFGYNGTLWAEKKPFIAATVEFEGTASEYFVDLIPDGTPNPQTGDISLIGFAAVGLISVLTKRRKVK